MIANDAHEKALTIREGRTIVTRPEFHLHTPGSGYLRIEKRVLDRYGIYSMYFRESLV